MATSGTTFADILALCEKFKAQLNAIRVGRVTIRVQDGRVLTLTIEQEYRRGYEITVGDLGLDSTQTVVYNIGDINTPTP